MYFLNLVKVTSATLTSTHSTWNYWVKRLQLHSRVFCPESPIAGRRRGVAPRLPGGDLALERLAVRDAPGEALPGQNAGLDLRHVEPASVLGRGGKAGHEDRLQEEVSREAGERGARRAQIGS